MDFMTITKVFKKDGVKEGIETEYYLINNKEYKYKECNYINGEKQGEEIEYYIETDNSESRRIYSRCYYKEGQTGVKIRYSKEGYIIGYSQYKNNKLNGRYIEYNINGNTEKICNYKEGKLDGEYKEYIDNILITHKKYKEDEEIEFVKYNFDGSVKARWKK